MLTSIKKNLLSLDSDYQNKKYLLAVSGGVDSVVLFHLFLASGLSFSVAHCNYKLRGKDSDLDQSFVENLCENYQVRCLVKTFDTKRIVEGGNGSTQMVARDLRYAWFKVIQNEHPYDYLVTAHHLTDHVETVLLNVGRGTGIAGLHGISEIQGNVLRPLLIYTKEELYNQAMKKDWEWREDISNTSNKYKRNLVRNQIIPLFKKMNPNFEHTTQQTIEKLQYTEKVFLQSLAKIKVETQEGEVFTDKLLLEQEENPILIYELIREVGFTYNDAKYLVNEGKKAQSGTVLKSADCCLLRDRNQWLLMDGFLDHEVSIKVNQMTDHVEFTYGELTFGRVAVPDEIPKSDNVVVLDADKLSWPLVLRTWQNGDRLQPLGMKGMKKVSDLLIDKKINLADKSKVCVLESAGKIIWILGMRLDDRFKITKTTKNCLKVTLS